MFPRTVRACVGLQRNALMLSVVRQPQKWVYYSTSATGVKRLIPKREEFASRHIGPRASDRDQMLAYLGYKVQKTKLIKRKGK